MPTPQKHTETIVKPLKCGLNCYYRRPMGKTELPTDLECLYYDPESWQDVINKIENDRDNYIRFDKMESYQAYRVMEDFAYSLTDTDFRDKILERLERRKPFQNFKRLIDASDYRQDWFDFKKKAYIEWVKEQV